MLQRERYQLGPRIVGRLTPSLVSSALISVLLAVLLAYWWPTDTLLIHAVLEISCVSVALGVFFCAWLKDDSEPTVTPLGLGYLSVAILDLVHTYHFPGNLGSWFWVLGRWVEAATLLLTTFPSLRRFSLRRMLLPVVAAVGLAIGILSASSFLLPPLLTPAGGVTALKWQLELLIIATLLAGLHRLLLSSGAPLADFRQWLLLSLVFTVLSECCFALYGTVTGFLMPLGHALKLASYCYLFRGTFVLWIRQPYQQLAAAEQRGITLLNSLPLCVLACDQQGRLEFANDRCTGLFELDLKPYYGAHLIRSQQGFSVAGLQFELASADEQPPGLRQTATFQPPHGHRKQVLVQSQELSDGRAIILLDEDTVLAKRHQLRLQTRLILNALRDICVVVDAQGVVLSCNEAFLQLFGLVRDQAEGVMMKDLWSLLELGLESPRQLLQRQHECQVKGADGQIHQVLTRATPIEGSDGTRYGYVLIGTEITSLKKQSYRSHQEENLAAIGQMVAGLAHEIRNPLTALKGYNQLLSSRLQESALREYSDTVDAEITALQRTISEFLELSRPHPSNKEWISLESIAKPLVPILDSHAFMHGFRFTYDLSEGELTVQVDKLRLQQAILTAVQYCCKLLGNDAHQHSTLHLSAGCSADSVCLTLSWTGWSGIGGDTSPERTWSVGVGEQAEDIWLGLCRQIVAEQNGTLVIEPNPGPVLILKICLPLEEQQCPGERRIPHE
jgi:PAS domain S-box-containing protein